MNIIDYLRWRGDLSFKVDPFNEVDNFIICSLSYLKIDEYLKKENSYTVSEINDIYFRHHSLEEAKTDKTFDKDTPLLLSFMANSTRYKDCVIKNFYSKYDEVTTEQFCGFEFVIDSFTSYIVFRGTDDTIVGWQEDFNISYMITPAQKSASTYLSKVIKPFHKYYVGGHSKGGNLALYAAIDNPKHLKKIINIYSNDGPGLNIELLGKQYETNYKLIKQKLIKFVPEYDVFGTIYDTDNNIVIKSSVDGVLAHSILTWAIEGNKAIRGNESNDTKLIRNAFKEFIEDVDNKTKKAFVEELFSAIRQTGLKNVSEFSNGGLEMLVAVIKNISLMDKDSKTTGIKLITSFVKQYKDNLSRGLKKKLDKK